MLPTQTSIHLSFLTQMDICPVGKGKNKTILKQIKVNTENTKSEFWGRHRPAHVQGQRKQNSARLDVFGADHAAAIAVLGCNHDSGLPVFRSPAQSENL